MYTVVPFNYYVETCIVFIGYYSFTKNAYFLQSEGNFRVVEKAYGLTEHNSAWLAYIVHQSDANCIQ